MPVLQAPNVNILTGSVPNPPLQFNRTLIDGQIETIFYNYNFARILALSATTGVQIVFGQSAQPTDVVGAGVGYEFNYVVPSISIINRSGGPITITMILAIGKIYDDRLNIVGSITSTVNSFNTLAASQVNVGNSAANLIAASANNRNITIQAGAADLWIGATNAVTAATGLLIPASTTLKLNTKSAVWGIRSGFSTTASIAEEV